MGINFRNYPKSQSTVIRDLRTNINRLLVEEMPLGQVCPKKNQRVKKLRHKKIPISCLRIKFIHFKKNLIK